MIPKYPMSDFHEINLDYLLQKYFEIDAKLASQIAGLKLDVNEHNILLKDADNNVLASIVAPYASEALTAASATRASNADEADIAIKDALGNHIVSYVKSVTVNDNVITFFNANGGEIASTSIVTGEVVNVDLHNIGDIPYNDSLNVILSHLDVNDVVELGCNYSKSQIEALFNGGNSVNLRHYVELLDPPQTVYTFGTPLNYDGTIHFGYFVNGYTDWHEFIIIAGTSNDTIKIKRMR